jgi:hypothetical protein
MQVPVASPYRITLESASALWDYPPEVKQPLPASEAFEENRLIAASVALYRQFAFPEIPSRTKPSLLSGLTSPGRAPETSYVMRLVEGSNQN